MKIIKEKISINELVKMAENMFGNFVKAVVDTERKIMAVDAELHADLESLLLENDSNQKNLWGINLYPEIKGNDWIEFDSMINIRPSQGNKSRDVENPQTKAEIVKIVENLVKK